ncbi:hypothetical protein [Polaribacter cellanae]|uniref:Uncharacterized protein n=1 Tax=Polaribacter cellanae TaxID=2818493 RepID=A0A975H7D0_9FLAO|nr:hypothetical protein [Polaribacter cellanae]QTE22844.1 hypothetical protein J3359_00795 [Polaribacter cellanae]
MGYYLSICKTIKGVEIDTFTCTFIFKTSTNFNKVDTLILVLAFKFCDKVPSGMPVIFEIR